MVATTFQAIPKKYIALAMINKLNRQKGDINPRNRGLINEVERIF